MDWGVFWGAVSALATIGTLAGVGIAWRTYRRQFARRKLTYQVSTVRLIRETFSDDDNLRVMFGELALADPYVITLSIESGSGADIPSASFDAGRPIEIVVSLPMIVTFSTGASDGAIGFDWSAQEMNGGATFAHVPPQLIRKGASGQFIAVTDGRPEVSVTSSLIDIPFEVIDRLTDLDRLQRRLSRLLAGLKAILVVSLVAFFLTLWLIVEFLLRGDL